MRNGIEEINKKSLERNESIFHGFLEGLREKGIRVSIPEWLQFLEIIKNKGIGEDFERMVQDRELLNKVRFFAQITLIKNKSDESIFHEVFDFYFGSLLRKKKQKESEGLKGRKQQKEKKNVESSKIEEKKDREVEQKESLGIEEVAENLEFSNQDHSDDDQMHGGDIDQHNDILTQSDSRKKGGGRGNKKGQPKKEIIYDTNRSSEESLERKKKEMERFDRRNKYERRPNKIETRRIIKRLRRIIDEVSEIPSNQIDIERSVDNFARKDFKIEYRKETKKRPEVVLLVDVGGSVDEWVPLTRELLEGITKGIIKLDIYLFHNNLYGYVWKPNTKNIADSNYAEPNSLINIRDIIKKRKKVIIYGDAEMAEEEIEEDSYPPAYNNSRIKRFGMNALDCLNFVKRRSKSTVWINPILKKEWEERDDSGTIESIGSIIPMHDLSIGGVEDAIKELMGERTGRKAS